MAIKIFNVLKPQLILLVGCIIANMILSKITNHFIWNTDHTHFEFNMILWIPSGFLMITYTALLLYFTFGETDPDDKGAGQDE